MTGINPEAIASSMKLKPSDWEQQWRRGNSVTFVATRGDTPQTLYIHIAYDKPIDCSSEEAIEKYGREYLKRASELAYYIALECFMIQEARPESPLTSVIVNRNGIFDDRKRRIHLLKPKGPDRVYNHLQQEFWKLFHTKYNEATIGERFQGIYDPLRRRAIQGAAWIQSRFAPEITEPESHETPLPSLETAEEAMRRELRARQTGETRLYTSPEKPRISSSQTWKVHTDPSLFAHIHGDLFIQRTGLEGQHQPATAMKYMLDFIDKRLMSLSGMSANAKKDLQNLADPLKKGLAFVEHFQSIFNRTRNSSLTDAHKDLTLNGVPRLAEAIEALPIGERIIIPGGWIGDPGHTIYYEIRKTAEGRYSFRFYNTGDGIPAFHASIEGIHGPFESSEKRYQCLLELEDVTEERLLHPVLLQGMLEYRFFIFFPEETRKVPTNYSANDIYKKLLPALGGKLVDRTKHLNEFIVPQHSGICSWAALMAVARTSLDPKNYDRLDFELKKQSLIDFTNELQTNQNLVLDDAAQRLLRRSSELFALDCRRFTAQNIISEEELKEANVLAGEALALADHAKFIYERSAYAQAPEVHFKADQSLFFKTVKSFQPRELSSKPAARLTAAPMTSLIQADWTPDIRRLDEQMVAFLETCQQQLMSGQSEPAKVAFAINEFLSKLSVPGPNNEFWKNLERSKVPTCMRSLDLMCDFFFQAACASSGNAFPVEHLDHIINIHKALAIMRELALQSGDKSIIGLLKKCFIELTTLKDCFSRISISRATGDYSTYNGRQKAELEAILSYMDFIGGGEVFSSLYFGQIDYESTNRSFECVEIQRGERDGESEYIEEFMKIEENRKKVAALPGFPSDAPQSEDYIAYARTDLSGQIMPRPFCHLKKVSLIAKYFLRGYIRPGMYLDLQVKTKTMPGEGKRWLIYNRPLEWDVGADRLPYIRSDHIRPYQDAQAIWHHPSEPVWPEIDYLFKQPHNYRNIQNALAEYHKLVKEHPGDHPSQSYFIYFFTIIASCEETFPKQLTAAKALSFFLKYPGAFESEQIQHIFRRFLYSGNHIGQILRDNPEFVEELRHFIQKGVEYFLHKNNISALSYFVYLAQLVQQEVIFGTIPHFQRNLKEGAQMYWGEANEQAVKILRQACSELNRITSPKALEGLLTQCKSHHEKALIYRQIAYSYIEAPAPLKSEDLSLLVKACAFLEAHPLPDKYVNYHLDYQVYKLKLRHTAQVAQIIQDGKVGAEFLDAILEAVLGKARPREISWNLSNLPLCMGNGKQVIFDLNHFSLYLDGKKLGNFPEEFYAHPTFAKLFPHKNFNLIICLAPNVYQITDRQGVVTRIEKTGQIDFHKALTETEMPFIVQQKHYGKWYTLLHKSTLNDILGSDILKENYSHWISLDPKTGEGEILLINIKSGKLCYKILIRDRFDTDVPLSSQRLFSSLKSKLVCEIEPIETDPEKPKLLLVNIYDENSPISFLSKFEPLCFQHLLKDKEGNLQKLEMVRLGIDFFFKSKDKELVAYCTQYPGFFISRHQRVKGLGRFHEYLVLENDKGEKMVLIPGRPIKVKFQGSLSTDVQLDPLNLNREPNSIKCFAYKLNSKGEIETGNHEQNLYLAYLALGRKDHLTAQSYLRRNIEKLKAYTQGEVGLFKWITKLHLNNSDKDPKASAVYLTAVAQLIKNNLLFESKPLEEKELNFYLEREYTNYFTMKDHMYTLALTPEEEILLLEHLKKLKGLRLPMNFSQRLEGLLKGREAVTTPLMQWNYPAVDLPWDWEVEDIANIERTCRMNLNHFSKISNLRTTCMVTRPSHLNLMAYYRKAFTRDADRLDCDLSLQLAGSPDVNRDPEEDLWDFLKVVFENPKAFPERQTMIENPTNVKKDDFYKEFGHPFGKEKENYRARHRPPNVYQKMDAKREREIKEREEKEIKQAGDLRLAKSTEKLPKAWAADPYALTPAVSRSWFEKAFSPTAPAEAEKKELHHQLSNCFSCAETDPPLFVNACKDIRLDIEYHFKQPATVQFEWNLRDKATPADDTSRMKIIAARVQKLKQELTIQKSELNKAKVQLEEEIILLANKKRAEQDHSALLGGARDPIRLEHLAAAILQNQFSDLIQLNPALTPADIEKLKSLMTAYMVKGTDLNIRNNNLEAVQNLEAHLTAKASNVNYKMSADSVLSELTNTLANQLALKRVYNPLEHLEYLVFEHYSGVMLRQEQVENLAKMRFDRRVNMIMQMIMGSGKSKVFAPILALMHADGTHLSMIIVPDPLYDTMAHDLQIRGRDVTRQTFQVFPFSRDTVLTVEKLQFMSRHLKNIITQRRCLIMKSRELESLGLKFREMMVEAAKPKNKDNETLKQQIASMQEILQLFKEKGIAIIDEADVVFNCLYKVIFTMGDPFPLNPHRYEVVSSLIECIRDSEVLPKIMSFQICKRQTGAPPYEEEAYKKFYRPALIEEFQRYLESHPGHLLAPFFKSLAKENLARVVGYLLETDASGEKFVASLEEEIKDALAVLKQEINNTLPLTLSKKCFVNFGPSSNPSVWTAIPFKGNMQPVETAQFGNIYELLNYLAQLLAITGITENHVKQLLHELHGEADIETAGDESLKTTDTAAFKTFIDLFGLEHADKFIKNQEGDVNTLWKALIEKPDAVFLLLKSFIFPKVKVYQKTLSSSPYALFNMVSAVKGSTGTPWNAITWPDPISWEREEKERAAVGTAPVGLKAKGVDGKTISILAEKCEALDKEKCKKHIQVLSTIDTDEVLDGYLSPEAIAQGRRAFIDTGSIFSGIINSNVAQKILARLRHTDVEGVVFYSDDNVQMVLERGKPFAIRLDESRLYHQPAKRFTYYDHVHTTGADLTQEPLAEACVTIGKDMTLRDFMQGAWRMRGLEKLQRFTYLITQEASNAIRANQNLPAQADIGFFHILRFLVWNEARQQQTHLISAMRLKAMDAALQTIFDLLLAHSELWSIITEVDLSDFFLSSQEDRPFQNFSSNTEPPDRATFLQQVQSWALKKIEDLPSELFERLKIRKEDLIEKCRKQMAAIKHQDLLPEKLPGYAAQKQEAETEVETEQETNQEAEAMTIDEIQGSFWGNQDVQWEAERRMNARTLFDKHSKTLEDQPYFYCVNRALESYELLAEYSDVFDSEFTVTSNFINIQQMRPFKTPQLPEQYFLLVNDPKTKKSKIVFLSHRSDVGFFYQFLTGIRQRDATRSEDRANDLTVILCDSQMTFVQHNKDAVNKELILQDKQMLRLRVQAKFFLGEISYSKAERPFLSEWIKEKGAARMEKLFTKHILPNYSEKLKTYKQSYLHKEFQRLKM